MDLLKFFHRADYQNRQTSRPKPVVHGPKDTPKLTGHLAHTLNHLQQTAGASHDFTVRHLRLMQRDAAFVFYHTLVDKKAIRDTLSSLQSHPYPKNLRAKDISVHTYPLS